MRTLAHISDLHFGHHDEGAAAALLAAIGALGPDLVVVSGDLTQRARRKQFEAARSFLSRIASPTLVIPGNHDLAPFWYPLRRFLNPLARFERYISRDPSPFYRDEEIAVLGLNTARRTTAKSGRVSHEQMADMKQVFGELPPGLFRILVTHHPLIAPTGTVDDGNSPAGRSRAALRTVRSLGIRLLLSGHHHRAKSGAARDEIAMPAEARSLLVAHAGTAISTRTREEENSFNVVRIEASAVDLAVMTWAGAGAPFAEHRRERFELGAQGWKLTAQA